MRGGSQGDSPVSQTAGSKGAGTLPLDIASLAACSLIWGTTWRAIKLEVGPVPVVESVIYRFALASALLFALCAATGRSVRLTPRQHLEALGQGALAFGVQYVLVYTAEQTLPSGALAVIFATVVFANLILFRIAFGQRASPLAWLATLLGLLGVAALSTSQLQTPGGAADQGLAIGLAVAGVAAAACGNMFAARVQRAGVAIAPGTAWAMGYGAGLLALWVLATGQPWRFEATAGYVGGLVYLAVLGSVTAFLVYYSLARRRGYTFAAYVAALTPPTAMIISSVTESTRWGLGAFAGLGLVLAGQVLLIYGSKS